MCETIKELMHKGYSKAEVARDLGISRQCWNIWTKENREFSDAVKEGEYLSLGWWEAQARKSLIEGGTNSSKLNTTLWIFNMKNRHGPEFAYRDKPKDDEGRSLKDTAQELLTAIAAIKASESGDT